MSGWLNNDASHPASQEHGRRHLHAGGHQQVHGVLHQGDQMRRIFAQCAIVYFGQLFKNYTCSPKVWAALFQRIDYVLISTKMDGATFWAIFSQAHLVTLFFIPKKHNNYLITKCRKNTSNVEFICQPSSGITLPSSFMYVKVDEDYWRCPQFNFLQFDIFDFEKNVAPNLCVCLRTGTAGRRWSWI
jgi:hypothetical protein